MYPDAPDHHDDTDRLIDAWLEALPREAFPAERLAFVLSAARRRARADAFRRFGAGIRSVVRRDLRPALAVATLVAVTILSAIVATPGGNRPAAPSPEVAEALRQVRWTLGFLADVGGRTGQSVRSQVLVPHVVGPVQHAVAQVLPAQEPN